MTVHEYRPGQWTALVTGDALALLHPAVPSDIARELWQLATTGKRLGAWVEYLAAAGIAALPSFAMVEAHPEGMRVLVRGEVEVELGTQVVSGRGYTTWREEVLPAADVTIRADAGTEGWLPVTGGIVRAAAARLVVVPAAAPAVGEEDEDVELTVARMPALAAAVGVLTTPPGRPGQEPAPDAAVTEGATGDHAAVTQGAAGDHAAVTADEPAAASATAEAPPAAGTGAAAETAEEDPQDSDDYDFLLWSTEQLRSHEAARQQTAAPAAEEPDPPEDLAATVAPPDTAPDTGAQDVRGSSASAPDAVDLEATRDPEPDEDSLQAPAAPFAPGPIIDSVPGLSRPARPTAPVGHPVDLPPPAAALAPDDDGDHDGQTVVTAELPHSDVPIAAEPEQRRTAPGLELVLSTGPRIEMDRPVLLGRAPEAGRFAGSEVPRLVSVANPERDISATHVEVRPAGGHVVVTDMNSTNGTVLHLPDQPPVRLQPGSGVPVGAGAVIELGVGVTVTVAQVEGEE